MVSAVYYTCLLWKLAKIFCGGIQLCARLVSKSLTRSVSVLTLLSGAVWYHLHNQLPVWSLLYPREGVGAISTKILKIMVCDPNVVKTEMHLLCCEGHWDGCCKL